MGSLTGIGSYTTQSAARCSAVPAVATVDDGAVAAAVVVDTDDA